MTAKSSEGVSTSAPPGWGVPTSWLRNMVSPGASEAFDPPKLMRFSSHNPKFVTPIHVGFMSVRQQKRQKARFQ